MMLFIKRLALAQPLFLIFLLSVSTSFAQYLVPITPAEGKILFLLESVKLSGEQGPRKKDETLVLIDKGLDQFLNFDYLASAILGKTAGQFTPAEIVLFKSKFRRLILLSAYIKSGEDLKEFDLTILKESTSTPAYEATLFLNLPPQNIPLKVKFIFDDKVKYLKDTVLNGKSLVDQYREDFQTAVEKYGKKAFLDVLDKKARELELQAR